MNDIDCNIISDDDRYCICIQSLDFENLQDQGLMNMPANFETSFYSTFRA